MKTKQNQPLTPRLLYNIAMRYGLADSRIRICDGMAVSYFPTLPTVGASKSKIVIDVSSEPCVEFDELSADDMGIIYDVGNAPAEERDNIISWIDSHAAQW